jgi:hypothetical protein
MENRLNIQNQNFNIPLIMQFAAIEKVEEDSSEITFRYNYQTQITEIYCGGLLSGGGDYKTIGTRSLKQSWTKKKGSNNNVNDPKNSIDDSKQVKR